VAVAYTPAALVPLRVMAVGLPNTSRLMATDKPSGAAMAAIDSSDGVSKTKFEGQV